MKKIGQLNLKELKGTEIQSSEMKHIVGGCGSGSSGGDGLWCQCNCTVERCEGSKYDGGVITHGMYYVWFETGGNFNGSYLQQKYYHLCHGCVPSCSKEF